MKRIIRSFTAAFFVVFLCTFLNSCGGGGGGGGGGGAAITTATGTFIDGPVEGLSFVSGGQSGVTGLNGSFTYEVGKTVKFFIGNVVLGEALPKAIMTPVDLVPGAVDPTDPKVVAITRCLLALNSNGSSATDISISQTVRTASQGMTPINLSTTVMDDSALQNMLTAMQAPNQMVSAADARTHMTNSISNIFKPYVGTYNGTFSGSSSGTFTVTVNAKGVITGNATTVAGDQSTLSGQLDTSGSMTLSASGTASTTMTGAMNVNTGEVSGTWKDAEGGSGTFSGKKTTLTYDGTWSGTTSQGRPLSITVANSAVTSITVGYAIQGDICSSEAEAIISTFTPPKTITGSTLSINMDMGFGPSALSYTLDGTFSSGTAASGNIHFSVPSCNGSATATWNATRL